LASPPTTPGTRPPGASTAWPPPSPPRPSNMRSPPGSRPPPFHWGRRLQVALGSRDATFLPGGMREAGPVFGGRLRLVLAGVRTHPSAEWDEECPWAPVRVSGAHFGVITIAPSQDRPGPG